MPDGGFVIQIGTDDGLPKQSERNQGAHHRRANGQELLTALFLFGLCRFRLPGKGRFRDRLCRLCLRGGGLSLGNRFLFLLGLSHFRDRDTPVQLLHGLGPVLCPQGHGFLQRMDPLGRQSLQPGQIPAEGILLHPLHRCRGHCSGQRIVDRRCQGVNVRPGAGAAPLLILLQRTEAALGYLHTGCPAVQAQILGGPQVQNLHPNLGLQHQVVRA